MGRFLGAVVGSVLLFALYIIAYAAVIAGTTYVVKCTWNGVWLW